MSSSWLCFRTQIRHILLTSLSLSLSLSLSYTTLHTTPRSILLDNVHVSGEDFCNICWVSELGSEPCIQLDCKHIFHQACLEARIQKKWTGPVINFKFLHCPLCNQLISHSTVTSHHSDSFALYEEVVDLDEREMRERDFLILQNLLFLTNLQ